MQRGAEPRQDARPGGGAPRRESHLHVRPCFVFQKSRNSCAPRRRQGRTASVTLVSPASPNTGVRDPRVLQPRTPPLLFSKGPRSGAVTQVSVVGPRVAARKGRWPGR